MNQNQTITTEGNTPTGEATVLLVEDEPMLRELALMALTGLGYRLLSAENGLQALTVIDQNGAERIHLLITDVRMPEMGGQELASRLRALFPHTKVLFCSGCTEDTILPAGRLDPGISFLQKPYSVAALANRVREILKEAA